MKDGIDVVIILHVVKEVGDRLWRLFFEQLDRDVTDIGDQGDHWVGRVAGE